MKEKSTISRQRKWQLKQKSTNHCIIYGKDAVSAVYCLPHAIAAREWQHQKTGAKKRINSLTYRLERNHV